MGSILVAECTNCGHETLELFVGGGFMNFKTVCSAPAFCATCREVVTANYLAPGPHHCPECSSTVRFYDGPSLRGEILGEYPIFDWHMPDERSFILPPANYRCPRCKQLHLRFMFAGNWD